MEIEPPDNIFPEAKGDKSAEELSNDDIGDTTKEASEEEKSFEKGIFIKTQVRRPHMSFKVFDDTSGRLLMAAKRTWAGYQILDDCERPSAQMAFNWGRTRYDLKTTTGGTMATIRYDYSTEYASYDMAVSDGCMYKSKAPKFDASVNMLTMKFQKNDYQASKKNCQLLNFEDEVVAELAKLEDGYYRVEFKEELSTTLAVAIALTRFHIA